MLLDGQRITSVVGRRGIGKSAVVAKVLAEFERADPSRSPLEDLDGLVYLSTRTGATSLTLARVYESILMLAEDDDVERLTRLWENMNIDALPSLWSALRRRRLVVVLDNLDDLQDESGELIDDGIVAFLQSVATTPHPPRVITTSQRPLDLPLELQAQVIVRALDEGLSIADGVALLQTRDGGTGLIVQESEDRLGEAVSRLHGIPRGLELVAHIILTDDPFFLDTLLESTAGPGALLDELVSRSFANLDTAGRHVVGLLALAGVPLPVQAVPSLLEGLVDATATRNSVRQSIRTRQIGYDPKTRQIRLHPMDADYVRQSLLHDDITLQVDLDKRLADWYAAARTPPTTWHSVADAGPNQREFEHRWRAGEKSSALGALAEAADLLGRKGEGRILQAAIAKAEPAVSDSTGRLYIERCRYEAEFFGGSLERAEQAARRGLQVAQEADMPSAAAEFSVRLGETMRHSGNPAGAVDVLQEVLKNKDRALERGDRLQALLELGLSLCYIGDSQAAETTADELASGVQPDDGPTVRAWEFDVRSLARLVAGDFLGAIADANRAVPLYADSWNQDNIAYLRNVCGVAHMHLDEMDAAESQLRQAADVAAEYGVLRAEGICAINRAWCSMRASRWPEARTFASQAAERLTASKVNAKTTARELAAALGTEQSIPGTEFRAALENAIAQSRDNADIYTPTETALAELVEAFSNRREGSG